MDKLELIAAVRKTDSDLSKYEIPKFGPTTRQYAAGQGNVGEAFKRAAEAEASKVVNQLNLS